MSSVLTWLLAILLYYPSDHDYLIVTTSYYFKQMTERGLNTFAAFDDCHLHSATKEERRDGVRMFGLCSAQTDTHKFYFSIAMSPTGNFVYADFEERSR